MPHSANCERDPRDEEWTCAADCPTKQRKAIWLCGACGRTGKTRETVGDESCYLHAVEVYEDSIEREDGRIVRATAIVQVPKPVDLITERLSI